MVAVHLLALEARVPPDARELEARRQVGVHEAGEVLDRATLGQDERPAAVGLVRGLLRVDADPLQLGEEERPERVEALASRGGDAQERQVRSHRLARERREGAFGVVEVALVAEHEDRPAHEERRRVPRRRPPRRPHLGALEELQERDHRLLHVVRRDVEDEQGAVRAVHEARQVRLGVAARDGGRVHELHLHVLERHHPGLRRTRREGVVCDLRMGVRERLEERRLPRVGRPEEHPLPGAFAVHVAEIDVVPAARHVLGLVLELGEACLEVALELLGALVLGEERQHLAQGLDALLVRRRATEPQLGVVVLGREVGWHRP